MSENNTIYRCSDPDCKISTGICGNLTFGKGELDEYGYWENICEICTKANDKYNPNFDNDNS